MECCVLDRVCIAAGAHGHVKHGSASCEVGGEGRAVWWWRWGVWYWRGGGCVYSCLPGAWMDTASQLQADGVWRARSISVLKTSRPVRADRIESMWGSRMGVESGSDGAKEIIHELVRLHVDNGVWNDQSMARRSMILRCRPWWPSLQTMS